MSNKKIEIMGIDLGGESRTATQLVDANNHIVYNYVIPPELISDGSDLDLDHIKDALIYGTSIQRDDQKILHRDFYRDQYMGQFSRSPLHPARPHDPPPQSDRAAFSV